MTHKKPIQKAHHKPTFHYRPIAAAIAALMSQWQPALANPTTPVVTSGSASFNYQGNTLNIKADNGTIVNWQGGFSIGAKETTVITLPTAASLILNRDVGGNPTQILGSLISNGHVFIINANGVVFGPNSRVDVAGLVASTLNLSDQDFKAGKLNFTNGVNGGKVLNEGTLNAAAGGYVLLIAADVENRGIINAPDGQILLAAGESVYLADPRKPEILIKYSNSGNQAINLGALVAKNINIAANVIDNAGLINANTASIGAGGKVILRAKQSVTLEKTSNITANGASGGDVTIQAEQGTTLVQGNITAIGSAGKGGHVELLGDHVGVLDNAKVDVSGTAGGGQILVGGDYQGKNAAVQNAAASYVAKTASLVADATSHGDGGKVIVWADKTTRAYGNISAQGGVVAGNGGLIETSGKETLDVAGVKVNASANLATGGVNGQWLLDPSDITIIHGSANALTAGLFDPATSSNIGDTEINSAINGGTNVTIQTSGGSGGSGNIVINNAVAILNSGGSNRKLSLHADNALTVSGGASISGTTGNLLDVDIIAPGGTNFGGTITKGTLTYSGGTLTSNSGIFDSVTIGSSLTESGTLTLNNITSLINGVVINKGNSQWNFGPNATLTTVSGTATINNLGGTLFAAVGGSGNLNIGAGIILQGYGQISQSSLATVNNAGTIIANTAGQTFTVSPNVFNNTGTLTANTGTLSINSSLTTAQLGTVTHLNGGLVNLVSTLDNTSNTVSVDTFTSISGTIINGTITGTTLSSTSGTLDGVTIGNSLTESGTLTFKNTTSLANGVVINKGNSQWNFAPNTTLTTVSGTATINNLGGTLFAAVGGSGNLNIGAGIILQGYGNLTQSSIATVNNAGSIIANTSGQTFTIGPNVFNNTGTLTANTGTLSINSSLTTAQLGTVTHINGGLVNLVGTLDNTSNTVSVDTFTSISGTVTNGTITGTTLNSASATLDGVTIGNSMTETGLLQFRNTTSLANGVVINKGANQWNFAPNATIDTVSGTATINNAGGSIIAAVGGSGNLDIAAGIILQGYGQISQSSFATVNNAGKIIANTAGQTFTVGSNVLNNTGTLNVTAGTLTLSPGTLTNSGQFAASGTGILNIGGAITTGSLTNAGAFTNRTGGSVNLTGTLTNGGTLDIGAAGFGTGGLTSLSGTIVGGTLIDTDSTPVLNSASGLLNGVTIGSSLTESGLLQFSNSLHLVNSVSINKGNSQWNFAPNTTIDTVSGTATINNAGGSIIAAVGGSGNLDIATGITLQGYGQISQSSFATVNNAGTIIANTAGQTFTVGANVLNNTGTLNVTAGTLTLSPGTLTNSGQFAASGTGILNIGGAITTGSLTNAGAFTNRTGGSVNLTGTLTNGGTLDIGAAGFGTGGLTSLSGTIVGGTLIDTDSTPVLNSASGLLNGVTIGSSLTESGLLQFSNSLHLVNGVTINKGNSQWNFAPNTTIDTVSGTATINNAGGSIIAAVGGSGNLDIAAGITLQGYGQISQSSFATVNNAGKIIANTAGQTFTVSPNVLNNTGTLNVTAGTLTLSPTTFNNNTGGQTNVNGGVLNITPTNWTNAGVISLNTGSLQLGGNFNVTAIAGGHYVRSGGTVSLSGVLDNTGNTLDIGSAGVFGTAGLGTLTGTIKNGTLIDTDSTPSSLLLVAH